MRWQDDHTAIPVSHDGGLVNRRAGERGAHPRARGCGPEARDNYLAKLVKYVPAPVIAFFVPAWEALNTKNQQWFVFLAFGIVGTLGWLFLAHLANKKATGRGTPAWFFILGVLSFGCWAIGTTDAGQQLTPILGVKIDDTWSWLILLTGAFFIPLADELLTIWTGNAKVPPGTPPAPPA